MNKRAEWRITFPVQKAEQRDSGFYVTGEASGPEIDGTGERMHPDLIDSFANQIISKAENGAPLVWRDDHADSGILRDLGELTNAWVTKDQHLGVEVKLDEDHPASEFLMKKLAKGKQYGMSVAGVVNDYTDAFDAEAGRIVRTYNDIRLTEISITTRPAWHPSFGSVLRKAIKDTLDVEDSMTNTVNTTQVETEEATTSIEQQVEETQKSDESTEEVVEQVETNVEKAGRKLSQETMAKLLGLYTEIENTLHELGLPIATEESTSESATNVDSGESEESVERSEVETQETTEKAHNDRETELEKQIAELTSKVAELERRPVTVVPPVVENATEKAKNEIDDIMKSLPAHEKLRVAFALHTEGK